MIDVYFDNSATTIIEPRVLKEIDDINNKYYANPSAMHRLGYIAEEEVKKANDKVSKILNCESNEIIWTSGGSESNNMAILGYVDAYKKYGNKIITTVIEHPSVYQCFKKLEEEGFVVKYLKVDVDGHVDIDELKNEVDDKTILVSIMYVNNEIGSVQKIDEIGKIIKDKNSKCAFHVDFVQGFGKYKIDVRKSKIDFLSISAHKFNGPKGVGILYKNRSVRVNPIIVGGAQQNGLRAGTLNTPGIVGTALACDIAYKEIDKNVDDLKKLKDYLINNLNLLNEKYGIISLNTKNDDTFAPHIVSISIKGIKAEVMLHALEEKNIYVSSGSACSSHDKKTSSTLLSIGLNKDIAGNTIRVSFGKYNTKDEIDYFISTLNILIPKLSIIKK